MKSYVSLDTKICPICTKKHEVGVIMDTRLKDSLEKNTITGWYLCPDCVEKKNDNYIALVGCDPDKSEKNQMEVLICQVLIVLVNLSG